MIKKKKLLSPTLSELICLLIPISHFSQICAKKKKEQREPEQPERADLFWNRTGSSSGCCHGFLFVGTNCRPVAESLSCCLLKISGKARGGGKRERGRQTDTQREHRFFFFFFFCVLTPGHPAETHSPPQSSTRPSMWGSR